jgi:hypothetical protein
LHALSAWAEAIPSPRLKTLRAAVAGEVVLVLGSPLPAIPEGNRYWGTQLLIPLGFRTDPSLQEAAIRRTLGIAATEILLFTPLGYERIPASLFKPLTLAGIRLAERSLRE